MTPLELYTVIRNQIAEEDPGFWGEDEIYKIMWNGEKIFAFELQCAQSYSTDVSVVNQREYARPVNAQAISRLTWDRTKLKKITLEDVDRLEGDTEDIGEPEYYYEYGNIIGLVPTPASAKVMKYYFNSIPSRLSASSTTFTIPGEYAHFIEDFVLYHLYMKDQQISEADRHKTIWEDNLRKAKSEWITRTSSDHFYCVRDEEGYPFTDLGMI